jgi:hypothetical protein
LPDVQGRGAIDREALSTGSLEALIFAANLLYLATFFTERLLRIRVMTLLAGCYLIAGLVIGRNRSSRSAGTPSSWA